MLLKESNAKPGRQIVRPGRHMRSSFFGLLLLVGSLANAAATSYECTSEVKQSCLSSPSPCSVTESILEAKSLGLSESFVIEKGSTLSTLGNSGQVEEIFSFKPALYAPTLEQYWRETQVERVTPDTGERYMDITRDLYQVDRSPQIASGFSDWVDGKNVFIAWNRISSGSDSLLHFWFCEEVAE